MEFITSTRGGSKLIFEGYVYVKQKDLANGAISYECELRRNELQCKPKLHVIGNNITSRINEHTHAPNTGRTDATKIKSVLKQRALDTDESAQQIITNVMTTASDEAAAVNLPAVRHIRRNIRRQRQQAGNPLPIPRT